MCYTNVLSKVTFSICDCFWLHLYDMCHVTNTLGTGLEMEVNKLHHRVEHVMRVYTSPVIIYWVFITYVHMCNTHIP